MEEYNWNLILKAAAPFSIIEAYIFYTGISDFWKWLSLIAALLLTGWIVHIKDKKKSDIFTAIGLVFLAVLVVRFLRNSGLI